MAKDGVLYKCDKPEIQKMAESKGNFFLQNIFKIRNLFADNIKKVIPQPGGALAEGLLFGEAADFQKKKRNTKRFFKNRNDAYRGGFRL